MRGCSAASGGLDDSKFAEPLPVVGLYVAGASLLCALAIGLDVLRGIRLRRLWFPCRYLSLNSATLTILGIATKFPVDLNTAMPSRTDQLSKLSSTILICTMMANITPSLGTMENPELVSNLIALGILVVTVVVNVCIQMGTGVIYAFLPEHAVVLYSILHLLVMHVYTAMNVPDLRDSYRADKDIETTDSYTYTAEELRDCVTKRLLAEDGASIGAQLEIGLANANSSTSAFGPLGLLILMEAFVRSSESSMFCKGTSEYKWSVALVLIAQAVAIVLGALPAASRCFKTWWFGFIGVGCTMLPEFDFPCKYEAVMGGRMKRKLFRILLAPFRRSLLIVMCMTRLANCIISTAVFFPLRTLAFLWWFVSGQVDDESVYSQLGPIAEQDIGRWISEGKKRKPTELMELIKEGHSHFKGGFGGVLALNLDWNPLDLPESPNCWAMHIVALTIVATALPDIDSASIESLLQGVHQGLRYVRLVDKYMEGGATLDGVRRDADEEWFELEYFNRWWNMDLPNLVPRGSSRKSAVQELRARTPVCYYGSQYWCVKRVVEAILEDYDRPLSSEGSASSYPFLPRTDDNLFPWLRMTISDVLRACLTNLPRAIYKETLHSSTEKTGEKKAKNAAHIIGEVGEEILPLLVNQEFAPLYPDQREHIRQWYQKLLDFPTV